MCDIVFGALIRGLCICCCVSTRKDQNDYDDDSFAYNDRTKKSEAQLYVEQKSHAIRQEIKLVVNGSIMCKCGSAMIKGDIVDGDPKCVNIICKTESIIKEGSCYYCPVDSAKHPEGFYYCNLCAERLLRTEQPPKTASTEQAGESNE